MYQYSTKLLLGALTLGASLAFGPAHAADEDKKADRAAQKAERRDAQKKAPGNSRSELDACKRDAQGKDGPERANFMTNCLKDR